MKMFKHLEAGSLNFNPLMTCVYWNVWEANAGHR